MLQSTIPASLAQLLHWGSCMEPTDFSRAEKTILIIGCIPVVLSGLFFLFA